MNRPPPRTCALCLDLEGFHQPARAGVTLLGLAHCDACSIHVRYDPFHEFTTGLPRAFALVRLKDTSGISGTGLVMQGVIFDDGRVAARWVTADRPRSTVLWDDFDAWYDVHVRPHPENESVVLFEDGHDGYDHPSLPTAAPASAAPVQPAAPADPVKALPGEGPISYMLRRFGEVM